ncbi:MAG: glycosyltransferase family 4 protein [Bacteroidetes bacterium]|nr:glycosyltransferase family 4 protein [Bacteroidota bacterium]MCL6103676.1 glycosyltransferase family 4 protein [Bacteroidota bacterium]
MIVGFEAKRIFQNYSGLGNYSRNTINLLVKFFPDNRYKLFAPKLTALYQLPESVEAITPTNFPYKYLRAYWRLNHVDKLLSKNHVDIFHGLSHVLPYGIEKTGIPSIVTIHDLIFLRYPEFYRKIDRKLYQSVYYSACKSATKIIAISNQTKEDLIHYLKIDPGKIEVIYQSCNPCFYERVSEAQKSAIRLKFNLPEKFILNVGTIEARKNQLSILRGLVQEKLEIPVVLLGKITDYKKGLDEFIVESGIRKQLIFLPNTDTSELQAIYQMAEIMVYPSLFEGFGLPVLEAQASGCPVITSSTSSLPEAGGDGAIYIDPGNSLEIGQAIQNVLSNNDLKNELIRKGTAHARLFDGRIVSEKLMKLYQSLVK